MYEKQMQHVRGRPYHRSMKNVVNLQHYYLPWELEAEIEKFIDYYNNERYHESINNVIPADMYYGRAEKILTEREKIKQLTMQNRRSINLHQVAVKDELEVI